MNKLNDGGPAFPRPEAFDPTNGGSLPQQDGMSLRDWFAGKAMQGLISSEPNSFNTAIMVRDAYIIADCMIEEREK